jgi:hypothetical protein
VLPRSMPDATLVAGPTEADAQSETNVKMLNSLLANGANGISDIEGKVAREAMSECGQRASFKYFEV